MISSIAILLGISVGVATPMERAGALYDAAQTEQRMENVSFVSANGSSDVQGPWSLDALTQFLAEKGQSQRVSIEAQLVADKKKEAPAKTPKAEATRPAKASTVLSQVQQFFSQAQDLQANFKQTYYKASLSVLAHSSGTLKIKKPKMMLWDYAGNAQDIYSNGDEVWFVEHDTRQVVSSKLSAEDNVNVGLKFLFGDKELLREYLVRYATGDKLERYGDATHWVLQLKPRRRNPHFKGLILVVDKDTGRVDRFVVYNHDDASNYFELSELKTNTGLDAGQFSKKIPAGYVETRE